MHAYNVSVIPQFMTCLEIIFNICNCTFSIILHTEVQTISVYFPSNAGGRGHYSIHVFTLFLRVK